MPDPAQSQPEATSGTHSLSVMEPFVPPRDYVFEEEFAEQPPRPIPPILKTGSFQQRERGTTYTFAALGIMCLLAHAIPFVETLSHYILPLGYLNWIGGVLLAIAAYRLVYAIIQSRFQYVRDGILCVGKVIAIERVVEGTEEYPKFRIAAKVEFQHPDTGINHVSRFSSDSSWDLDQIQRYVTTLQPDDLVTLVFLPGKFWDTLAIYGFLGLNPEREFLLKDGQPLKGTSPSTAVMIACITFLVLAVILMAFDVVFFSFPLDDLVDANPGATLLFGGAGTFVVFLALTVGKHVRERQNSGSWNKTVHLVTLFASSSLGLVAGLSLLCVLNSQFDNGVGKLEPVEIVQYWHKTYNLVFRTYQVEYRPFGKDAMVKKSHIRYSQMAELGDANFGALEVGRGAFGIRWARGICPAVWIPAEAIPDIDAPTYWVTMKVKNEENREPEGDVDYLIKPVVQLKEQTYVAAPEELSIKMAEALKQSFPDMKLLPRNAVPAPQQ